MEIQQEPATKDSQFQNRSIIIVGVGDGPFGVMEKFDDEIPSRKFDNLQFVNFYNMRQYSPLFDVNFR
jgi:hypothetical protein